MIIGTGVDILEINRIDNALKKQRFLLRVYTERERAYILSKQTGAETATGIFCAKEAVAKALGTGFSGFGLTDIEILRVPPAQPFVELHGGAKERYISLGGKNVFISISHSKTVATATCIIEK